MVFADVLSDNIVVQIVGTLSDLRGCRGERKAQKKKRAERLTCNAGRLMRVEQHLLSTPIHGKQSRTGSRW